jgi:CRP-like cAMP-binding protein
MYVVKDGEANIVVHGKVVETVGPGGIVGELALIDTQPRSATVVAKTDCQLVPIDEKRFMFLVQQTPYFSLHVMRVLADRLRRMDERA